MCDYEKDQTCGYEPSFLPTKDCCCCCNAEPSSIAVEIVGINGEVVKDETKVADEMLKRLAAKMLRKCST